MITTITMNWFRNVAQIGVKKISRKSELKNPREETIQETNIGGINLSLKK